MQMMGSEATHTQTTQRYTQVTQHTLITDNNSLPQQPGLEFSHVLSHQEGSIPPTSRINSIKSKPLISSYVHNMQKQKSSLERGKYAKDEMSQGGRNPTQKLSLTSNSKDKENRTLGNRSKEKLHLTTLHPNMPNVPVTANIDMDNKENILSERDMFRNISITNRSELNTRSQDQLKQRIQVLQGQLQVTLQRMGSLETHLEYQQVTLMQNEGEIKLLRDQLKVTEIKYLHCRENQQRLQGVQTENEQRKRTEKRLVDKCQQYQNSMHQKSEKMNTVILDYQNEICMLKEDIGLMKSTTTSGVQTLQRRIRELQAQRHIEQNSVSYIQQQFESDIQNLRETVNRLQGDLVKETQKSQELHSANARLQINYRSNQAACQPSQDTIVQLKKQLETSQKQALQFKFTLDELYRKQQLNTEDKSDILIEKESLNRLVSSLQEQNKRLANEIQIRQVQNEALNRENMSLKTRVHNLVQASGPSVIYESFKRHLQLKYSITNQQQLYRQIDTRISGLTSLNEELKQQIDQLVKDKHMNQALIIKIQDSIERKLADLSVTHQREYESLAHKYGNLKSYVQGLNRKKCMQKTLISKSNQFTEEIYAKCRDIYHADY